MPIIDAELAGKPFQRYLDQEANAKIAELEKPTLAKISTVSKRASRRRL